MFRSLTLATALMLVVAGPALADPIIGNWKTDSGAIAQIAASGGGKYRGTITDPAEDKSYSGNAMLNGDQLAMQGCVAMVFCRTQNWQRR